MKEYCGIKYVVAILFCCFSLIASGMSYRVQTNGQLNMRVNPTVEASVVGKLQSGDIVESNSEVDGNGWIEVSYQGMNGYVKASYLQEVTDDAGEKEKIMDDGSMVASMVNTLLGAPANGSKKLAYLILAEILVMWFIGKFIRGLTFSLEDTYTYAGEWLKWTTPIIMLVTSATIFYYVKSMGANSLWFLQPSVVKSWWYVIVNFIFFFYAFSNLILFFLRTIGDLAECFECDSINIKVGVIGWGLGIIGLVVSFLSYGLFGKNWFDYILWFELVVQAIQVIIIVCSIKKNKAIGIVFSTVVYLVGSAAIVLLALPLAAIATCVAIALVVICFLPKGVDVAVSANARENSETSPQQDEEYNQVIKNGGVFGSDIKAKDSGFTSLQDENGNIWDRNDDGSYSKR